MLVTKCDQCQKIIPRDEEVIAAGLSFWKQIHLCGQCGAPIRSFLEKKQLIERKKTTTTGRTTRTK